MELYMVAEHGPTEKEDEEEIINEFLKGGQKEVVEAGVSMEQSAAVFVDRDLATRRNTANVSTNTS